MFTTLWTFIQPVLFGIVGTSLNSENIDKFSMIIGALVIFFALLSRAVSAVFLSPGIDLNLKERIFLGVAGVPKATVQVSVKFSQQSFVVIIFVAF